MTSVTDRTGASDAPAPSPAELAVIERFGIFEAEESVEKVARAIMDADYEQATGGLMSWLDLDAAEQDHYRRLDAAAIAAMPVSPAPSTRAMLDVADNLDYYASRTTGGTHASGLEDAAAQIRAAVGALPVSPAEEALRRVEALAAEGDEYEWNGTTHNSRIRAAIAAPQTGERTTDEETDRG